MVATVLAIKFRTQRHLLERERWRFLIVISGAVWAMVLLPWAVFGTTALLGQNTDIREDALVAVAAVAWIGWAVVPVLITGLDDTLDPGRFASFGVSASRIMGGLTAGALLTIPVVFFAALFVIVSFAWHDTGVLVVAVAIAGALLTTAALVFGARVVAMWSTRVLSSRRARWVTAAAVVAGLALIAPFAWVLFNDGLETVLGDYVPVVIDALADTPLGAGMSAPHAASEGDWWGAAWRIGMLAVWAAALWGAWRANVAFSLVHPRFRGAGTRRRDDGIVNAGNRAWPLGARHSGATAAVRARLLKYWFSDPRYLANLIGVFAFPVIFFALVMPVLGLDPRWSFLAPILLAASIGWGRHNDVAYDSSALWLDVVSGRLGASVMRGRISAVVAWALPATVVSCFAVLAWSGLWALGPALLSASVGVLLLTLAVSAMSSVLFPYRAPAPGENPLGAEVGSVGAGLLAQLVSSMTTVVLLPLLVAPLVLALTVDVRWGWLTVAAGLVIGPGAYLLGLRGAGRIYDARSGKLLGAVT